MIPQVRVLCAGLWRSLSSEGVPLRCGLQTWQGLLCEVCVVLCSGRGRGTVSLVTRANSRFVAANRVLKRGRSGNDVVLRKTLCCEARPHLPDKKDKAGRERVTCTKPGLVCLKTRPATAQCRLAPPPPKRLATQRGKTTAKVDPRLFPFWEELTPLALRAWRGVGPRYARPTPPLRGH